MIAISNMTFAYRASPFYMRIPSLAIAQGERAAIIGPSGAGKTTLLNLVAGILVPDEGSVRVGDMEVSALPDAGRRAFRIANIGMIFQEFELLEYLTVRENILLPYRVNKSMTLNRSVRERAEELARALGIGSLLDRWPDRVSQGERQRAGICRALITNPALIFADEPTGNLDSRTGDVIAAAIMEQAAATRATVLMVTHDRGLLDRFDRVIDMEEERV